jgi:hypothetical protein
MFGDGWKLRLASRFDAEPPRRSGRKILKSDQLFYVAADGKKFRTSTLRGDHQLSSR